jgi:hypothetical protein
LPPFGRRLQNLNTTHQVVELHLGGHVEQRDGRPDSVAGLGIVERSAQGVERLRAQRAQIACCLCQVAPRQFRSGDAEILLPGSPAM